MKEEKNELSHEMLLLLKYQNKAIKSKTIDNCQNIKKLVYGLRRAVYAKNIHGITYWAQIELDQDDIEIVHCFRGKKPADLLLEIEIQYGGHDGC